MVLGAVAFGLLAQSPDASLRGLVTDRDGKPVNGASVYATQPATGLSRKTVSDSRGRFAFESLPRGLYTLRAEASGYRGVQVQGVELAVGARREETFTLAPMSQAGASSDLSAVLESLPPPPGLQVETIASSVSVVVEESKILQLPLSSRNIYSLFLLQPGVTSQGAIVRRGLSFSVHGQRVSGSNYRLDGVDNNDIILTGPATATSAEAIQEFRRVNSSFSAENGRATAFVAQVVTRSGSNRFRGSLFEYLGNDDLDANTFQSNAAGLGKAPLRRNQFGGALAGPLRRNRTFFSFALEFSRLHFGTVKTLTLPSPGFIAGLPESSLARRLLTQDPPLPVTPSRTDPNVGQTRQNIRSRIDSLLGSARLDHQLSSGRDRFAARYTPSFTSEQRAQEFFGYPSLWPTDEYSAHNALAGWTHIFRSGPVNDLRLGWNRVRSTLDRLRPEVPILQGPGVELPGSRRQSAARENDNVFQLSDSYTARLGRSAFTAGFEYHRNLSKGVSLGLQSQALGGAGLFPDGFYQFDDMASFASGAPEYSAVAADRFSSGSLRLPDLARDYRSNDFAAFFQTEIKLRRRLSLSAGLRYEYFGVPHSAGPQPDYNYYFGAGSTIEEREANGVLRSTDQNPGDLRHLLYRRDRFNFAPSIGLAWDPVGKGKTVLRAGYSLAFDRVFDTLRDLRTNVQQVAYCIPFFSCSPTFVTPAAAMLADLSPDLSQQPPGDVIQLDEGLRTPYAQNWFAGLQHSLTANTLLEVGHAGSVGTKLISRDYTNRPLPGMPSNPLIGLDTFLSNAGTSNYLALEASVRRRYARGLQLQLSYTYSHAIDNQSDPFEGVRTGPQPASFALAAFTRQFDARLDRGNSNFDQRHNFIMNAVWDIPAPRSRGWKAKVLEGWVASVIGGHRSGFPVTTITSPGLNSSYLSNNRPDLVRPSGIAAEQPVTGGVQWLDPTAFVPVDGRPGTLGRGALPGPGFWSYDFALLKNFVHRETGIRVQFRAEFYNLLNHANLSAPDSLLLDPITGQVNPGFGRALYGINRTYSRFGDLLLENPSRVIQLGLRLEF